MTMNVSRRLVVTVSDSGFLLETETQNRLGYWNCLSRTFVTTFPLIAIGRVADRDDYAVIIRRK